jgi:hypothetical protein
LAQRESSVISRLEHRPHRVSRLYFASAYRDEGWIWTEPESDPKDQTTWLPWLQASAARFAEQLRDTPEAWLTRRIEMIDRPGQALSGWRLLMLMLEHAVHHRSQIDAYAACRAGWCPTSSAARRSPSTPVKLTSASSTRGERKA